MKVSNESKITTSPKHRIFVGEMDFDKIIGQDATKHRLRQMAESGRIPHAQIFLGPEGCGKLAAALAFAKYALCQHKENGETCGRCSDCIKADKNIHPDIHFSFPTVGSKMVSKNFYTQWRNALESNPYFNVQQWLKILGAENKQGNITKDECHDIVKKLSLKTFEGQYKILIMWRPEFLGKEGNRLLKLIEEPPEQTLFLLVAEDAEQILNTILSRCQIVKFTQLDDDKVKNALLEKGIEAEKAETFAHLAHGNFNEALTLSEEIANDNAALFIDWLRICYLAKPKEVVTWSDDFSKIGRENQKYFFDYGLFFLREYMMMKMTGRADVRLAAKEHKAASNLTKVISYEQIEPISVILTDSAFHISRNANPKILMTDITIRMNNILRNKAVS